MNMHNPPHPGNLLQDTVLREMTVTKFAGCRTWFGCPDCGRYAWCYWVYHGVGTLRAACVSGLRILRKERALSIVAGVRSESFRRG